MSKESIRTLLIIGGLIGGFVFYYKSGFKIVKEDPDMEPLKPLIKPLHSPDISLHGSETVDDNEIHTPEPPPVYTPKNGFPSRVYISEN